MKNRVRVLSHDATDLFDRKQHAGFIIGHHYRNDSGIAPQLLAEIVEVQLAAVINFQPGYVAANLSQVFTEIAHGLVLNACGDDVTTSGILFQKSADGPVV